MSAFSTLCLLLPFPCCFVCGRDAYSSHALFFYVNSLIAHRVAINQDLIGHHLHFLCSFLCCCFFMFLHLMYPLYPGPTPSDCLLTGRFKSEPHPYPGKISAQLVDFMAVTYHQTMLSSFVT